MADTLPPDLRESAQAAHIALTCISTHPTLDMSDYLRGRVDAAAAGLEAALAAVPAQPVLDCEIQPRPLAYPLTDYHRAGVDGPLHYTWKDKPHRLLYDLIAAVRYYAAPQAVPTDKDSLMVAQAVPVPAGWALVPVEPTPEMLQAGVRDVLTRKTTTMADTYRAMLAAAPKEQPHE